MRAALTNASNLLGKSLGAIGDWKSDLRLNFAYAGDVTNFCDPSAKDCYQTGLRVLGKGEAVLVGRLNIPASQLPMIGQYLGNAVITTNLSMTIPLSIDGQATGSNTVCTSGSGKITGSGAFAFRVAGYRAEGQVIVEEGALTTDLCLWPQVTVKCTRMIAKKIRLVGTVEDKWGLTRWNIDYTVWNGLDATLNTCP